jgi:uncharacterized protein YndB with AHSA1/START domain
VNDRALRLERLIAAPPERVFELWTEPALLVQWWGPEGYQIPAHALDVRPGGKWITTLRGTDGVLRTVSGVYRTVERPKRLVMSWAWHDEQGRPGHETEIVVTFDAAPGGTRLVLLQQEFATTAERDAHAAGWTSTFNKLGKTA